LHKFKPLQRLRVVLVQLRVALLLPLVVLLPRVVQPLLAPVLLLQLLLQWELFR
jgi:hypothetical protein